MAKTYTEAEIKAIAKRGRRDPSSLTADEVRAVSLYVHLRNAQKNG